MRRRPFLSVPVLAVAAALVTAHPAPAADSFTFYGSGFGHGLGLSQWGAYGLAQDGWNHRQILTHFYSGTKVAVDGDAPARLRIGLTHDRGKIRLRAIGGRVTLRVADPKGGPLVGEIPAGETWRVRAVGNDYRVIDAAGERVGDTDWGGPARHLYATYEEGGGRVKVPEGGATYNRGSLEFNLYRCGDGECVERLILTIGPQAYLYGLAEVPSSWPRPALRAQAVAARSYAFAKAANGQHRKPCNCALYDTPADQVYIGWAKENGLDGDRWVGAVNHTDGQVVRYGGDPIQAFYSSSSGGHTENNENVWGGTPLAWLRGVCDPGDFTPANPSRVWQVTYSADEVTARLEPYTGGIGTVEGFDSFVRGVSGRVVTVRVEGSSGSYVVTGNQLRAALSLRDDRVWINRNKNVVGAIRAKYDRLMCAPGLPTTPAVDVGTGVRQRFEVGAIIRNEAVPVTVWLRGPTYTEYTATGGVNGPLGLPTAGTIPITGVDGCAAGCSRTTFDDGRIYWKSGLGAFGLWGRVLDAYLDEGGAKGSLGFPTSRVTVAGDGTASATFEHGAITCEPGSDCVVS
jgi:SpoIID/LytB domain protein